MLREPGERAATRAFAVFALHVAAEGCKGWVAKGQRASNTTVIPDPLSLCSFNTVTQVLKRLISYERGCVLLQPPFAYPGERPEVVEPGPAKGQHVPNACVGDAARGFGCPLDSDPGAWQGPVDPVCGRGKRGGEGGGRHSAGAVGRAVRHGQARFAPSAPVRSKKSSKKGGWVGCGMDEGAVGSKGGMLAEFMASRAACVCAVFGDGAELG